MKKKDIWKELEEIVQVFKRQDRYSLAQVVQAARVRGEELEARLKKIQACVDRQAEDKALWFISKFNGVEDYPITINEAYLQNELRKLHRVIEGEDDGSVG